jgi:hypothetical protein
VVNRAWLLVLWSACYRPTETPVDAPDDVLESCPVEYKPAAGAGKYKLADGANLGWVEAEAMCEADRVNATSAFLFTHLAVVTSLEEQRALGAMTPSAAWVGYSDRETEGVWLHVTREPSDYPGNGPGGPSPDDPWNTGEPNGFTNENCGYLFSAAGERLDDRGCSDPTVTAYICECDLRAPSL